MASKRYKFSRYGMYSKIEHFLSTIELPIGKCLLIGDTLKGKGRNTALTDMLPDGCDFVIPDYPEVDIHNMPYLDLTFKYVIADQVLEHVRRPWIAIDEVYRVLEYNGIVIFTTCLMQSIHGVPNDYWRFTKDGLMVLFENFKILSRGQNGNFEFIKMCETGYRGQRVETGSFLESKAVCDDGKCPLTTWIIAKK